MRVARVESVRGYKRPRNKAVGKPALVAPKDLMQRQFQHDEPDQA
jgi:hypothetical protein